MKEETVNIFIFKTPSWKIEMVFNDANTEKKVVHDILSDASSVLYVSCQHSAIFFSVLVGRKMPEHWGPAQVGQKHTHKLLFSV